MFQETVSPDDLLAAERALVRPQTSVRLDVFGQVVLHFEALGAHGTGERAEVEVLHLYVPVPHALQRVGFAAVAVVNFACVGRPRERRGGGGERRRGTGGNRGRPRGRRDGLRPGHVRRSRCKLVQQRPLGNLARGLLDLVVGLESAVREASDVNFVYLLGGVILLLDASSVGAFAGQLAVRLSARSRRPIGVTVPPSVS